MSRLYLRCVLCSRQQAQGLISGAAWGTLALPSESVVHHPAVVDSTARACPSCVGSHRNWEQQALTVLGLSSGTGYSVRVDA